MLTAFSWAKAATDLISSCTMKWHGIFLLTLNGIIVIHSSSPPPIPALLPVTQYILILLRGGGGRDRCTLLRIDCFCLTSLQPYRCSKTMLRRPRLRTKAILWELGVLLLSYVNTHFCSSKWLTKGTCQRNHYQDNDPKQSNKTHT